MKANMSPQTRKLGEILRPLTRAEAKRASSAAVAYLRPELTRDGHSRFRALGAQLYVTKPAAKGAFGRLVEVLAVDYLNRRHVRVVVDGNRVVEVRELDWQPAFSAEELAEADTIVARDPRLRNIVRRRGVFASAFSPGGSGPGTRRIGLRYLRPQKTGAVIVAELEVDLAEQELVAVATLGSQRRTYG
jgi:hypothetical protein